MNRIALSFACPPTQRLRASLMCSRVVTRVVRRWVGALATAGICGVGGIGGIGLASAATPAADSGAPAAQMQVSTRAAPAPSARDSAQSTLQALSRAHAAVVGVQVRAAEGARSADTLGRARSGTGVIIDAEGLVLTIGYLILEADQVQIVTQDERTVPARVVAYDLATGFGLVRPLVPLKAIAPAPLGSLDSVKAGDIVMAVVGGEDGDVDNTYLVSKRSFSGYWEYHIESALFTSPPLQSGGGNHSGAALFNQRGELVGIGSLFVADAVGQAERFGLRMPGNMFVPVDLLKPILREMEQTGTSRLSRRPWLGLTSSDQGGRVQVVRVAPDSPAQGAGLKSGDVVLAIDGTKVSSLESFYKALWQRTDPEGEVQLTILQGSDVKTLTLRAVDRMRTLIKPSGV